MIITVKHLQIKLIDRDTNKYLENSDNLFLKTKYLGDPLKAHVKVDEEHGNAITELHFGTWINLWFQTIDELFIGDYAENAKHRARKMGTFLYLKIFESRLNKC